MTFVCESCRSVIADPLDQVEVSREYRRQDHRRSFARIMLARLCVKCMRAELESIRPPERTEAMW